MINKYIKSIVLFLIIIILLCSFLSSCKSNKRIVYTDHHTYLLCRSGKNARKEFRNKCGMNEDIFPAELKDKWSISNYIMIYYNPFDPQYLGYIVIDFPEDDYLLEVKRLQSYPSTNYIGVYGISGFSDYKLLAINADSYYGIIYALTDCRSKIIYIELIFCNYYMDLDYRKYIPDEYLPDDFNASINNSTREKYEHNWYMR